MKKIVFRFLIWYGRQSISNFADCCLPPFPGWTVLAAIFFLLPQASGAQAKSFTDYYFEIKTLTSGLKTYNVVAERGDHQVLYPYTKDFPDEIRKSFNFLSLKKRVYEKPDFVFRIVQFNTTAKVSYTNAGVKDNEDVYNIEYRTEASFQLRVEIADTVALVIPLVPSVRSHRSIRHTVRRVPEGPSPLPTESGWKEINIDQEVALYQRSLDTGIFVQDFNDLFKQFRNRNQ